MTQLTTPIAGSVTISIPDPPAPYIPTLAELGLYVWPDGTVHNAPYTPPQNYTDVVYPGGDIRAWIANLPAGTAAKPTRGLIPVDVRATITQRALMNRSFVELWGIAATGNPLDLTLPRGRITTTHPGNDLNGHIIAVGADAAVEGVRIVGLELVGSNPGAGTPEAYIVGRESGFGVSLWAKPGSKKLAVVGCKISAMTGHGVYVRGMPEDVDITDNLITGMGVMGINVANGKRINVLRNQVLNTALYSVNVEDGDNATVLEDFTVKDNIIDGWSLTNDRTSPTKNYGGSRAGFSCWMPAGMTMARWLIEANTFRRGRQNTTGTPYGSTINVGGTSPKSAVTVRGNRFESVSGPVEIYLENVTGGATSDNSPATYRLVSCAGIVQT